MEGLPCLTGRLENAEGRDKSRTIRRGKMRRAGSRVLAGVEVRGQAYLLVRALFASTLAGGSRHPQRGRDTNHDPAGSNVLQAIVQQGEDKVGIIVIVRTSAAVVGRDILKLETLQKVAGGNANEVHDEEKKDTTPLWDSQKELPSMIDSADPGPDRCPPPSWQRPQ